MTTGDHRHARQMALPGVGEAGQARLRASHALVVGCGALGCVEADLLVRAGVGHVTIVDRDVVERSNLQRQMLFDERDLGAPKALAARQRLAPVDPDVRIDARAIDLTPANAERVLADARSPLPTPSSPLPSPPDAVILDACDTFETRLLLNDLAVEHAIPFVHAGVVAARATTFPILPANWRPGEPAGACLACLLEDLPRTTETCQSEGVFGPAASIVASVAAGEAIRILLGLEPSRTILAFDLWTGARRRLPLPPPRADCRACTHRRFEHLDGSRASDAVRLCGRSGVQISPEWGATNLDLDRLASRLAPLAIERWGSMLRATLEAEHADHPGERVRLCVFDDARVLVLGTTDLARARAIKARYLGG